MRLNKQQLAILLILNALLLLGATCAQAWWNDQWAHRRKITFDTTAAGADIKEPLGDIPVLLRLHTGNFNFDELKADGSDLRFVSADDKDILKYQIERFDVVDEIALVWVKVPKIEPASNQNFIWMYYGNEEAADSQDPAGTFGAGQVLVYHMGESEGAPQDATTYGNHASHFSGGQALPSVIGNGMSLYGGTDRIVIPYKPALSLANGFTFSTWIKINQPQQDGYLLSQSAGEGSIVIGVDGTGVYCRIKQKEQSAETGKTAQLTVGDWHYLAVMVRPGAKIDIFVDGQEAAATTISEPVPSMESDIIIGGSSSDNHVFSGDLDELTLSTKARSADWFKALYESQGPSPKLVQYGEAMAGGGGEGFMPVYYLRIIAKNISLDGWLIIGILIILGILSWMVLVGKVFFLYLNDKDNRAFQKAFNGHGGLFCLDGEYEEFDNSPLHRVYRAGCKTLTQIFSSKNKTDEKPQLSVKEMNAFRTTLEKGFIEESKGFNAWLVIMTLAISGGPFLGLLGTVWGVMNTFAAMAEAGEANIMAIAPGVASALATTVFGLIVAIPALFGYNYLTGKIKDLTADMSIFMEEFTLLVDEYHGGE